jgi:hypothetical protein
MVVAKYSLLSIFDGVAMTRLIAEMYATGLLMPQHWKKSHNGLWYATAWLMQFGKPPSPNLHPVLTAACAWHPSSTITPLLSRAPLYSLTSLCSLGRGETGFDAFANAHAGTEMKAFHSLFCETFRGLCGDFGGSFFRLMLNFLMGDHSDGGKTGLHRYSSGRIGRGGQVKR